MNDIPDRNLLQELLRTTLQVDPFRLFPTERRYETYNPSDFLRTKGFRTIREMLIDDQVKAALAFKKLSAIASGWQITSPDDAGQDYEPALFIEDQLLELPGTFNQRLEDILTALEYGFSVTEKVYKLDDDMIGLRKLQTVHPEWVTLRINEFGELTGVSQEQTGVAPMELPPGKVILFSNEPRFGNLYGTSDLQAAHKHWWGKTAIFRYTLMYMERFGIPPIFALVNPESFTTAQLADLQTVIANLQAGTAGYLPRKGGPENLELWTPDDSGRISTIFEPVLQMLNANIARALLMPGLLGMTPDAAEGSYARSQVHFDVFMLVIERLRQQLTETLNEELVRPLVALNFGDVPMPRFEFLPLSDDVRLDILEAWSGLVEGGSVRNGEMDEAHIRTLLKFPEVEQEENEGDDIARLTGTQIQAVTTVVEGLKAGTLSPAAARELLIAAGMRPAAAQRIIDGTEVSPPAAPMPPMPPMPSGNEDGMPGDMMGAPPFDFAQMRQQTSAEERIDFAAIEDGLDGREAETVNELVPILEEWQADLTDRARREELNLRNVAMPESLRLRFSTALRDQLDAALRLGRTHLRQEAGSANMAEPVGVTPESAATYLENKAFWVTGVMSQQIEADVQAILVESLRQGRTAGETASSIRAAFVPYVGDPDIISDDVVTTPWRLETIVRTNTTDAYNQGRLVDMRDPDVAPLLKGVQYSAILDARTTDICRTLDRRIFRPDDPDLDRFTPPNHYNCRSVLVPIILSEDVDPTRRIDGETKGKVEDMMQPSFGGNAER